MANRHSQRDQTGRFSPAPVPQADTSVNAVSGDPQGEHDRPVGTVYTEPVHDPRFGMQQRLIPHRRQRVIDTQTGEEFSDHITDVRAVLTRPGGRTATHVVEIDGEPFWGEAQPEDTMRSTRRTPGSDGYRLPSMYHYPDVEH